MVSRSLSFRLIALVVALLGSLAAPASAREVGHMAHDQGAFAPRELFQRGAGDAAVSQRRI